MQKKHKKTSPKKYLLALSAIILLATFLWANSLRTDTSQTQTPPAAPATSTINLNPPTEEEKQTTSETKENITKTPPVTAGTTGKKAVTPIIISADQNGASAYVPGIFEEGGTCTAVFTHGGDSISVTSKGFQNSNYTSCAPLTLNSPLNILGDWTVVVSYASSSSAGQSAALQFKVK